MLIEIVWNGETTAVDLVDGTIRVGGAVSDDIRLEGLAPSLLTLKLDEGRVTLKAQKAIRVGAALFPAHVARLVLEGEEVRLPNDIVIRRPVDALRIAERRGADTAFIAREIMGGLVAPQQTRAASLTCVTGHDVGTAYALAFKECVLGRGSDVDIRLHDRSVSRHHARLVRRSRHFLVEDLGTPNGVYVNSARVKGFKMLNTGDIVEMGQTMLRFDGPERGPGEATVAEPRGLQHLSVTEKQLPEPAKGAPRPVVARAKRLSPPAIEVSVEMERETETATERLPWRQQPNGVPRSQRRSTAWGRISVESVLIGAGVTLMVLGLGVTAAMMR